MKWVDYYKEITIKYKLEEISNDINSPRGYIFQKGYIDALYEKHLYKPASLNEKKVEIDIVRNIEKSISGIDLAMVENIPYLLIIVPLINHTNFLEDFIDGNKRDCGIEEYKFGREIFYDAILFIRKLPIDYTDEETGKLKIESQQFFLSFKNNIADYNYLIENINKEILIPFIKDTLKEKQDASNKYKAIKRELNPFVGEPDAFIKEPVAFEKKTTPTLYILLSLIVLIVILYYSFAKEHRDNSDNQLNDINNLMADTIGKESPEAISYAESETDTVVSSNKANIDFNSNENAIAFEAKLIEGYNAGEVNFADYYIAITWSCGTGCVNGKMVDIRDGKVYDLPLGEDVTNMACPSNDEKRISFEANSNLLKVISCGEIRDESGEIVSYKKRQYNNTWDESRKEFILTMSVIEQ